MNCTKASCNSYEILTSHVTLTSRTFMPAAIIDCSLSTRRLPQARSCPMLDIAMLALGLAFFALSIGYAHICDRL